MSTELTILTVNQIIDTYKLPRTLVYELLKTKGCPVLPRDNNRNYRVIQSEFENWLKSRRA